MTKLSPIKDSKRNEQKYFECCLVDDKSVVRAGVLSQRAARFVLPVGDFSSLTVFPLISRSASFYI